MTHHDPLDELASAHLDGATTPEEAALVETDPELQARVEALGAVRSALAVAPLVDDERREQAIAAALAAYDEQNDTTVPAPSVGSLTPLADRRRGPSPHAWRIIGAAAAVAALAALVPLLASLSSRSDNSTASLATAGRDEDTDAQVPSAAAESDVSTSATTPTAPAYLDLGTFENDDALVQEIRDTPIAAGAAETNDVVPDPTSCIDELIASLPEGAVPVLTATATVAGDPTTVVITPDEVRLAGVDCTRVRVRAL